MKWKFLPILAIVSWAGQAQPVLTGQQKATLKKSPIPVFLPTYTAPGYELREVVNNDGYQLVYALKGKPTLGGYPYIVEGLNHDRLKPYSASDPGVKKYPVKHPTLGATHLWFLPDKMRGGPLSLQPLLKGKKGAYYNLEGGLDSAQAIKVVESLQPWP